MKCSECGYEHRQSAENWIFLENGNYQVKSNLFDGQILKEIVQHACSSNPLQKEIYIDTWIINTLSCTSCLLQNLRHSKREIEQKYESEGLIINYYF